MKHENFPLWQLFVGDASQAEARVYAQVSVDDPHEYTLGGRLLGPECRFAHTLTASFRFVDRGPGRTLLAEAIVPDPCYWTMELPFLYRAEVELLRQGKPVATASRSIGLRRLGVRRCRFSWEHLNWVLRGVDPALVDSAPLSEWRESATAMVVESPSDDLLDEASRVGVGIVASCDADRADPRQELARVSRFPAAIMFAVRGAVRPDRSWRALAPNLVLAQNCTAEHYELGEATQVAVVTATDLVDDWARALRVAVVVERNGTPAAAVSAVREQCDQVQRDHTAWGDIAGYLITQSPTDRRA